MTENFGWAIDLVLRLPSINLLVHVTRPPQLVKKPRHFRDGKKELPIASHVVLLQIFWKSPWSRRIRHKSWKIQLSMKENIDLFWGKKQNGRKGSRRTSPFQKTYYWTYIFFWLNFHELVIQAFTCILFFQMLIKYLKVNVIYEWIALQCLLLKASGSMSCLLESVTIFLRKNSKLIMKDTKQKFSWIANYEAAFQNLSSTKKYKIFRWKKISLPFWVTFAESKSFL